MRTGLSLDTNEADAIEENLGALERALQDRASRAEPVADWGPEIRRIRWALESAQERARNRGASVFKRDSQRSKIYRAENASLATGEGDEVLTVARATAYVRAVANSPFVAASYPRLDPARVKLVVVPSGKSAGCRSIGPDHTLTVPVRHLRPRILLHEIAHAVANAHYGKLNIAGHGPEFAVVLARLVKENLGPAAQRALALAFITAGVVSRHNTSGLPWDAPGAPHLARRHALRNPRTAQPATATAASSLRKDD